MLLASKLLIPVLLVATGVGAMGVWDRLMFGKAHLAFGSYVPWGLWVGLYIYLVGVSAGAFVIAFLYHGLRVEVLIPHRDRAESLARALDSLRNQTVPIGVCVIEV